LTTNAVAEGASAMMDTWTTDNNGMHRQKQREEEDEGSCSFFPTEKRKMSLQEKEKEKERAPCQSWRLRFTFSMFRLFAHDDGHHHHGSLQLTAREMN